MSKRSESSDSPLRRVLEFEKQAAKRRQLNQRKEMVVLCKLRRELMRRSAKGKREYVQRAYHTAADVMQETIENYPGGRDYFWGHFNKC